jgi:hypothetical protein
VREMREDGYYWVQKKDGDIIIGEYKAYNGEKSWRLINDMNSYRDEDFLVILEYEIAIEMTLDEAIELIDNTSETKHKQ